MAEVAVALGRVLTADEARRSPCLDCAGSPCCTYLPIQKVAVGTYADVEQLRHWIGFERMVLGLLPNGEWTIYYHAPCRHLRDDGRCGVYGTPDKPSVCSAYNPWSCWYRSVFDQDVHPEGVRLDERRLDWVVQRMAFDEQRRLVAMPGWDELLTAFATLPLEEPASLRADPADPVYDGWLAAARAGQAAVGDPQLVQGLGDPLVARPCEGCAAPCCTHLTFPQQLPTDAAQVDHQRFVLGFPGVSLEITDTSWNVVVETRCRHLEGTRCGLYGKPERPLPCTTYQELGCDHRVRFLHPRPEGRVRVRLAQLPAVLSTVTFDAYGRVVGFAPVATVRAAVEAAEAAR